MKEIRQIVLATIFLFSFSAVALATDTGSGPGFIGQWIWSARDAEIFNDTCLNFPDLVPSIWVSTISVSDGRVIQRLANAPGLAGTKRPVAVVIRFDDSFNSAWNKKTALAIAAELDKKLYKLTGILADTGMDVREVQLDYDCPVRRLEDWSRVVRALSSGSLKGRSIWITSLPSHIRVPGFGSLFRGSVEGHILQVFDTGVSCDGATVEYIVGQLRRQKLAFRLGLGAFERTNGSRSTDHRHWFSVLPAFSSIAQYRGVWVFPGGNQWRYLL